MITAASALIACGATLLFFGIVFKDLTYRGSTPDPPTTFQEFSRGRVSAARRHAPLFRRAGAVFVSVGAVMLGVALIVGA